MSAPRQNPHAAAAGEVDDDHCLFGEICDGCGRGDAPAEPME
ncbi:MAG TPA: hypothetical protein VM286_05460 [Candidatus Thermoplasmatota archaeon]|nr:hypothetical protein [Candidatus Thermoplasmatota archaeon]